MKHKQLLQGIGASIGMLILIIDGKTAVEGAQIGIDLCLKTVIPSLFPFFVLSILLTASFSGTSLTLLLSGFLGGYPVGAQCISQAYHSGQLKKADAEKMLSFCNNAGPAFLFGMVAAMFPERWMGWALWGIHIVSALLVAKCIPGNYEFASISRNEETSFSQALNRALRIMASVCGWVVLFRVVIAFLKRWVFWMFPMNLQVVLTGLLELSNGCCELPSVADTSLRFVICSGILAFGGLCVTMQTISVTNGLSLRYYFPGKAMQTVSSLLISSAVVSGAWKITSVLVAIILLIPVKKQKNSSIRTLAGV